jgi:hypothetical protein
MRADRRIGVAVMKPPGRTGRETGNDFVYQTGS